MEIKKRIVAFFIVACTVFTLCACGGKGKEEAPAEGGSQASQEQAQASANVKDGTLQKITAKEVGTFNAHGIQDAAKRGIIYYDENDKYGIYSYDKKDTGAKYFYCKEIGDYFAVALDENGSGETDAAKKSNVYNLVNANGDILISKEYASFEALNERYVIATEVADITTSKDNAILYSSDKQFSFMYEEGDTLYSGSWVVYDMKTKSLVPNVGGTVPSTIQGKGDVLVYRDSTDKTIAMNGKGIVLPENANVFDNGTYAIDEGNSTTVYDGIGTVLFELDLADASIINSDGDYYRMSKYADGKSSYFFVDAKGNKVSGDFESSITMAGKFVDAGEYLCKLDGTRINTNPAKSIYFDDFTKAFWSVTYEDGTTEFIDGNGVVYSTVKADEALGVTTYPSDFGAYKDIGDKSMYYSFKDKDFTIDGNQIDRFVYKKLVNETDYIFEAFDTISGNKLFNCKSTTYASDIEDGQYYIVAENADESFSVYLIR